MKCLLLSYGIVNRFLLSFILLTIGIAIFLMQSSKSLVQTVKHLTEDVLIFCICAFLRSIFLLITISMTFYRYIHPSHHPVANAFQHKMIGHRAGVAPALLDDLTTSDESLVPENTLASFRHAAKKNIRIVEFDVRMSKDGIPIVFHDMVVTCTLDVPEDKRNAPISSLTLDEIKSYKLLSTFSGPEYINETIPTLSETLELCKSLGLFMMIEIKQEGPMALQCARETASLIKSFALHEQCYVASFFPQILHAVRAVDTAVCTGFLYAGSVTGEIINEFTRQQKSVPGILQNRIVASVADWAIRQVGRPSMLFALGHSIAAVDAKFVSSHLVKEYARYGITVLTWTVNNPTQQRHLFENLGISVISDSPLVDLQQISNQALDTWIVNSKTTQLTSTVKKVQ